MAGLYFHIPFCSKACTYCDFHFSTNMKNKGNLLAAMEAGLPKCSGVALGVDRLLMQLLDTDDIADVISFSAISDTKSFGTTG